MTMRRIHRASLASKVLPRRGVRSVTVTVDDAKRVRKRDLQVSLREFLEKQPEWPKEFDGMLNGERTWLSPTHAGYINAHSMWMWVKTFIGKKMYADGIKLASAWVSCLVVERTLLRRKADGATYVAVSVQAYGVIAWRIDADGPPEHYFPRLTHIPQPKKVEPCCVWLRLTLFGQNLLAVEDIAKHTDQYLAN